MTERTSFAERLYASLPVVYRVRDREPPQGEVLAAYLGACGDLLDALRQTLVRRHADIFPDSDGEELACQDWVLPYLADLVAARLVSPDPEGRRQEVVNAIGWRQRKGTRFVAEQVVENVGQFEAELTEGWQKVAVTARVDAVKLPARAYGVEPPVEELDNLAWRTAAPIAARHPTLVSGTVDLRCPAGAVRVSGVNGTPTTQAARRTRFGDEKDVWWRQASVHGVPCLPGSFDDPSRRTADSRTPRWDRGHAHPRRLLLHVPAPGGLCGAVEPGNEVSWALRESDPDAFGKLVTVTEDSGSVELRPAAGVEGLVRIVDDDPGDADDLVLEFAERDVTVEGLVIEGELTVTGGAVRLIRSAVASVAAAEGPDDGPAVYAVDSLLGTLDASDERVMLEYVTVLGEAVCGEMLASDSVFREPVSNNGGSVLTGCIRYSRVDRDQDTTACKAHRNTSRSVVFFSDVFGEHGCGVLHPASDGAVLGAAEDGGEPGAHHHMELVLRARAALDKLRDYLPLDIVPVLIPDTALLEAPAEATSNP